MVAHLVLNVSANPSTPHFSRVLVPLAAAECSARGDQHVPLVDWPACDVLSRTKRGKWLISSVAQCSAHNTPFLRPGAATDQLTLCTIEVVSQSSAYH